MEAKTMGSFLAALRKGRRDDPAGAAEQLHVSDKAVSRWERDECAPDLALIPVIAEIFSVTCDELLRGAGTGETRPATRPRRTSSGNGFCGKHVPNLSVIPCWPCWDRRWALWPPPEPCWAFCGRYWASGWGPRAAWWEPWSQLVLWNGAVLSLSDDRAGDEAGLCRYELLRRTEGALLICAGVLAACCPSTGIRRATCCISSRGSCRHLTGRRPPPAAAVRCCWACCCAGRSIRFWPAAPLSPCRLRRRKKPSAASGRGPAWPDAGGGALRHGPGPWRRDLIWPTAAL